MRFARQALLLLPVAGLAAWIGYRLRQPAPARWQDCDVLLIVSDALRRDALGCYGGRARTPRIDSLARRGALFENAYTTSPATVPSSTALLTGAPASAWYLPDLGANRKRGFYWVNGGEPLLSGKLEEAGYAGLMDLENPLAASADATRGLQPVAPAPGRPRDAALADALGRLAPGRPFFALKWFMDPHMPYDPPASYLARLEVDPASLSFPPTKYLKRDIARIEAGFRHAGKRMSEADDAYLRDLYRLEVESVDERVGRLLDALRRRGTYDRTIVVFTADHGESFSPPLRFRHGFLFRDCLVRVPLLVSGPGIPPGRRRATAILQDLAPTLGEMIGIGLPARGGRSLVSVLLGRDEREGRPVFFDAAVNRIEPGQERYALLDGGWKLVVIEQGRRVNLRLHHPGRDPAEKADYSEQEPDRVRRMLAACHAHRRAIRGRAARNALRVGDGKGLGAQRESLLRNLKTLGYL